MGVVVVVVGGRGGRGVSVVLRVLGFFCFVSVAFACFRSIVLLVFAHGALKALAAWYRSRFTLPVVQITGSAGKTTTKEMVAAVLSRRYDTLKTQANINNDIGTPLTLLGLAPQECVVVEDAPAGVLSGLAAGCHVIAVNAPADTPRLNEVDLVLHSLEQITVTKQPNGDVIIQ